MIAKFGKPPKWFRVKAAKKPRNLGGLASVVLIREAPRITGTAFIKFDPDELLPNLGQYLPFGVGPAHTGYLSFNHVIGTPDYRVVFEYLDGHPVPQWLWTQQGLPEWVKFIKYQ